MQTAETQRRIRDLEEMAAICSYAPDKRRFLAQADELKRKLIASEQQGFRRG